MPLLDRAGFVRSCAIAASGCVVLAGAVATSVPGGGVDVGRRAPGLIVYWSESPWPSIWSMRPDGSRHRRILRTKQNAKRPRLAPDRTWVAFDGAPPGKPPLTDFDIQLVRLDGSGRRTLTRTPRWEVDPQWSPDGRRLAFTRLGSGANWRESWIWTIRRDGARLRRTTRGQFARWSPDGAKLVFAAPTDTSDGDLFISSADGRGRRLLLASPELDQPADWSPDGRRILFTRFNGSSGRDTDVCVVNSDGSVWWERSPIGAECAGR